MEKIQKRLFEMQDLKYRDFNAKLIPNIAKESIIGVRTPQLRAYAKELQKSNDKYLFIKELPHKYHEENCLHVALITTISKDINEVLNQIEIFLPYVTNWSICDCFAAKIFAKHPDIVYPHILKWIQSNQTYSVRFGVVTLLQFFLDKQFKPEMLDLVADIHSDEYYINMAIAWYYSFALIKQYESTIPLFEQHQLPLWIHNKSIQKAIESYRISDEKKMYLRSLKRK